MQKRRQLSREPARLVGLSARGETCPRIYKISSDVVLLLCEMLRANR